jgi:hypothetical protein
MIAKPLQVKATGKYSIWLIYDDGTQGEINLNHLADKPVFKKWENNDFFNSVSIDNETDAIRWDENIELCPDSLYLKLKGITFEQWKANQITHASDK